MWWTRVAILTVTRFCLRRQLGSRIWTDIRTLNPPYGFKSVKIFNGFETRMWHITVLKIAKKIYGFKNRIRHLRFRKSYTNFTFSITVDDTHYTILKTPLYYILYKMQLKGFVSSIYIIIIYGFELRGLFMILKIIWYCENGYNLINCTQIRQSDRNRLIIIICNCLIMTRKWK